MSSERFLFLCFCFCFLNVVKLIPILDFPLFKDRMFPVAILSAFWLFFSVEVETLMVPDTLLPTPQWGHVWKRYFSSLICSPPIPFGERGAECFVCALLGSRLEIASRGIPHSDHSSPNSKKLPLGEQWITHDLLRADFNQASETPYDSYQVCLFLLSA